MLEQFRKIKEPYRMLLIGGLTPAVLCIGERWPAVETGLGSAFLAFLAVTLYRDLREPVNYTSLDFDSRGFRHVGIGGVTEAAWLDICDAFYLRTFDPFANQIETEWQFVLKSGKSIEVLVEWPHRRSFASAIQANLDFVSKDRVVAVLRMRGEGRWRCD